MYLSKILLQNFRSYDQQLLEFNPHINLFLGPNGSGKTNILEAIYTISSGKSFRTSSLAHLIKWDKNFASIRAKVVNTDETEIEVQLIKDPTVRNIKRKFLVQKVEKPRKVYLGNLKTVVFDPEDVRLVAGSPTRRRDFLDAIFSQTEWRYSQSLTQYNKALKHRNELLDIIYSGKASKTELFYWDQSLIKNSKIIHDFRNSFFRSANLFFSQHPHPEVRTLHLAYYPSALTQEKLDANYQLDLHRGHTQAGIHRDDYVFESSIFSTADKNLALWGSRGQQRLAVLAIKLAEINFIEETTKTCPVLLLDDIFSELDPEHQELVRDICQRYQSFFSSSEETSLTILPQAHIIRL